MRILCRVGRDDRRPIFEGWGRVFRASGHEFTLWDPASKPAFDAFDESDPDLYIQIGSGTRAVSKCLMERTHGQTQTVALDDPQPAADTFLYLGGGPAWQLKCDYAYVGRYSEKKRPLIQAYIGPLLADGRTKIMGAGGWPYPECLGTATDETCRDLYASAKVCLNLSSGLATTQRVYQILLAGGCCVTNMHRGKTDGVFSDGLVLQANTASDFHKLARLMASPAQAKRRSELAALGRRTILEGHTYWHRCRDLFTVAGFHREAEHLMGVYRASVQL